MLRLLADTFVLLYKTRYGVWHAPEAAGPRGALRRDHRALNASGEALAAAARDLGRAIPASYADLARFSHVTEGPAARPVESWTARIAAGHARITADAAMLLLPSARTTDARVVLLRGRRAQHLGAPARWVTTAAVAVVLQASR